MSSKSMSLKKRINNYAKQNNIAAQVVLQNYMFERLLVRLSDSEYKRKFVIKGGMLVAAIIGLDTRSTMDLDTTLQNLPLTEEKVMQALKVICAIKKDDDVFFDIISIAPIRKDDKYGGYCVRLNAIYDSIVTPLSIDVSTGDIITPAPVKYEFSGIFDKELRIELWGYNIETVMAEKTETILTRGIYNTRPRDYYDVYILGTTQNYDKKLFFSALTATARHRNSLNTIEHSLEIYKQIAQNKDLQEMWTKYQKKFEYAKDVTYQAVMNIIKDLLELDA